MDPIIVQAWIRVFRDLAIVSVGIYLLVHEAVVNRDPNLYLIAAGLTALGLPPAFRLDGLRRDKNGKFDD